MCDIDIVLLSSLLLLKLPWPLWAVGQGSSISHTVSPTALDEAATQRRCLSEGPVDSWGQSIMSWTFTIHGCCNNWMKRLKGSQWIKENKCEKCVQAVKKSAAFELLQYVQCDEVPRSPRTLLRAGLTVPTYLISNLDCSNCIMILSHASQQDISDDPCLTPCFTNVSPVSRWVSVRGPSWPVHPTLLMEIKATLASSLLTPPSSLTSSCWVWNETRWRGVIYFV